MTFSASEHNSLESYLAKPRGDKHIRLNISRNTLMAFVVSMVLHLLVLLFVVPKIDYKPAAPSSTIEVSLAPKPTTPITTPAPPQAAPTPEQKPKVIAQKPTTPVKKSKPRDFSVPKVLTQQQPAEQVLPTPPIKSPAPNATDVPTDMASYVAQQRAKREAQDGDAASQNAQAAAAERGPSEAQKRDARINENLKVGTNGIFEIKRLGSNSASFSFRGWTDNAANAKLEYFEVEARSGEDVRLLMVRRMIALIRKHYQGDFDWESHRLGRTIIKSARVEDSAELEDFLMQEFFGRYYKTQ